MFNQTVVQPSGIAQQLCVPIKIVSEIRPLMTAFWFWEPSGSNSDLMFSGLVFMIRSEPGLQLRKHDKCSLHLSHSDVFTYIYNIYVYIYIGLGLGCACVGK